MKLLKGKINIIILTVIFISTVNQSFAQIKLWESPKKSVKTQGVFCTLESYSFSYLILKGGEGLKVDEVETFTAGGLGIANAVASSVYTGLVHFSTRDEKQYSSKINALNSFSMKSDSLFAFKATAHYLTRKDDKQELLFSYKFIPEIEDDSLLIVSMNKLENNYSPVRLERKHHFVSCVTTLTVKAIVIEDIENKGASVVKTMELGKMNFTELSLRNQSLNGGDLTNSGNKLILPKTNDEGGAIEIIEFIFSYEISHVNPIGTTQRGLNKVLTDQSDNSTALIEALAESLKTESAR